ncbi:MAG: DUF2298 domain-containing protein [Anaerolineae bacterium]
MDFTPILIWWLIIQLFGLIGWLLALNLLGNLPDRGYAFARPLGLLLVGYVWWLGGSFGLLRISIGGIVWAIAVVIALGVVLVWRRGRDGEGQASAASRSLASAFGWLRSEWRYVLTVELLFTAGFVGWAVYKAYNPNIETAGGEKWMEIAFINANLRSSAFPPQDPWLSGFGISYYYFGYVLMSMATRLSGIVSISAFNLYVPSLFAMTLTGAFGVVANLIAFKEAGKKGETGPASLSSSPSLLYGLLAALFVAVMGHLEGLLEVFHARGLFPARFWTWLDIRDLKAPPPGPGGWIPDRFIWWWRGSRVLTDYNLAGGEQEVIDEFPFFSFLLADVHPHVLALPFVLLAVGLALNLFLSSTGFSYSDDALKMGNLPGRLGTLARDSLQGVVAATGGKIEFAITALCLGALGFLNTWDFPIYLLVMALALALWHASRRGGEDWPLLAIAGAIALGFLGFAFYFPFYIGFQSQARGLLPNLWNPTRLPQFLVFFGPFLVGAVGVLLSLSGQRSGWRQNLRRTLPLAVLGPLGLLLLVAISLLLSPAGREFIQATLGSPAVQEALGGASLSDLGREIARRRLLNPWTFLLVGGLLGWTLALLWPPARPPKAAAAQPDIDQFVLILLTVGLLLPLSVEFVYLRDNFGIRMNTIFKFYFQAWVLLALASAYGVYIVSRARRRGLVVAFQATMAVLIVAGLVYPILAILNKTGNFGREPTLNGIAWIQQQHPDDYAGIMWLRQHATDGAVVLEAPGASYAAYQYISRVSALTGLPTLLGWGGHQSQWRGNYDEPARREPDIEILYNGLSPEQALTLLDKYDITYVYVGPLERERYNPAGLSKFGRFMDVVFQQGQVTIYQRRL